jgi:hypothetical protein
MTSNAYPTREAWLEAARDQLVPLIERATGLEVPRVRVSCGFPGVNALSKDKYRVGECWASETSGDDTFEIFLTPRVSDPFTIADTLLHELIHAVVGPKEGHKGEFRRVAKKLGFGGPFTVCVPGPELTDQLIEIVGALGPYPHAALTPPFEEKKQTTRMLKVECPDCGYTARVTRKWLKQAGAPHCPQHEEMRIDDPNGLMDEEGDEE